MVSFVIGIGRYSRSQYRYRISLKMIALFEEENKMSLKGKVQAQECISSPAPVPVSGTHSRL